MGVVWVLFGILVGMTAANKQGFGLATGALGGLLLGPFSVLMFFVSGDRRKCPDCAEWVKKEARICPHCKSDLTSQPIVQKETPKAVQWVFRIIVGGLALLLIQSIFSTAMFYAKDENSGDNAEAINTDIKEGAIAEVADPVGQVAETAATQNDVPDGEVIPRSIEGDQGTYYLLEAKRNGNIIAALYKRIGVSDTGYTRTETNCETMLMREMGYSGTSPEQIIEKPTRWFELVSGSSKGDLANFVCSKY